MDKKIIIGIVVLLFCCCFCCYCCCFAGFGIYEIIQDDDDDDKATSDDKDTKATTPIVAVKPSKATIAANDEKKYYLGCWQDNANMSDRMLTYIDNKTFEDCRQTARSEKKKYFGLQDPHSSGGSRGTSTTGYNMGQCFIGDDDKIIKQQVSKKKSNCNKNTRTNSLNVRHEGGFGSTAVYKTEVPVY